MSNETYTRSVLCSSPAGLHRLNVHVHEPVCTAGPELPPVVCVHGLTRTGRDFDALAAHLAGQGRRVLCPDMVGRGGSDWLRDPQHYHPGQYAADIVNMLNAFGLTEVDWVGTSMGGLIAFVLAADPLSPVRRLVINDVGSVIPAAALDRIGAYMQAAPQRFDSMAEVEAHLRRVHAPFGALSDAQWRHLAETSVRPQGQGWGLHYDPAIGAAIQPNGNTDLDLGPLWQAIQAPTLILRGEDSDLLPAEVAREMVGAKTGEPATIAEIAGCGHAPALMDHSQMHIVSSWIGS